MQQPDLFSQQPKPARTRRRAKPQRDYRKEAELWRRKYAHVYRLLEKYALEMASRRRKFGAKALIERVRWQVHWEHDETPKLNNNLTAYLARFLVEEHPELSGLIETRETKF